MASLVATANQAQFSARTINPVTLVRTLHAGQQVVVSSESSSPPQPLTLLPQSVLPPQGSGQPSAIQQAPGQG